MSFCRLEKGKYPIAKEYYLREKRFYPLVSAVLDQSQDGVVFANHPFSPNTFFVEHKFGFSQIYGVQDSSFYRGLRKYLFADQAFIPQKIRSYAPSHRDFFQGYAEISERCQFRLVNDSNLMPEPYRIEISVQDVTQENAEEVDQVFKLDLFNRFWGSKKAFLKHGMAKVLRYQEKFASICYASAVSNGVAEIDVATIPEYRRHGFGRIVCSAFIRRCSESRIIPNWDCFTNNIGSMRLAESLGFAKYGEPYTFFTVNKTKNG
jgi:RimJ/RimL family protein N-acetyltransferase